MLGYVGEGSSPQAQRLREGHRNYDRGRNPSSLIRAKGHPELTTTKAIEKKQQLDHCPTWETKQLVDQN